MKRCRQKTVLCRVLLFMLGGVLYNLIEILWRGRTHYSMFFLGGICFHIIGSIYTALSRACLAVRCLVSSVCVTAAEFLCGCIVNLRCHMQVWDYSARPLNLCGQICLLYSILWALLSIPTGYLYCRITRYLRMHLGRGA